MQGGGWEDHEIWTQDGQSTKSTPSPPPPDHHHHHTDFRFESSDSSSSSSASTTRTSDDPEEDGSDFIVGRKKSAKYWTNEDWAVIGDPFLYSHGFALLTQPDFRSTTEWQEDPKLFFAERASALKDEYEYCCIRQAIDLRYPYMRSVYVRAVVNSTDSHELEATEMLMLHSETSAHCIPTPLRVLDYRYGDHDITFLIQQDVGTPCHDYTTTIFRNERAWRLFVLDCFRGLAFLHSLRIAHLDISPMNVLYNPITQRPAFIDFEGCVIVRTEEEIQIRASHGHSHSQEAVPSTKAHQSRSFYINKGGARAINARLPELTSEGFDVFAADVWCLGDMLRNLRSFPDDDIRALLRFMCMKEPRARPTMAYALEKLQCLLASDTDLMY